LSLRPTNSSAEDPSLAGEAIAAGLAECPAVTRDCSYPPLSVPPSLRSPSGEPGQILLGGVAKKVSLYHGFWTEFLIDRELDWHVHIDLPSSTKRTLITHLGAAGCRITAKNLEDVYSEHMVLDSAELKGDDPATRYLGYRSADVSLPFRLEGSQHPAWDLGLIAARHPHRGMDFSKYSKLCKEGGYTYLQGAFVNDAYHGIQLEIHPLDAIAFAMDKDAKTLSTEFGERDWPSDQVRWRVAAFTNSTLHRVNRCLYLQKERVTKWFLALPGDAYRSGHTARVDVIPIPHRLWNGVRKVWYGSRGVKSVSRALTKDPRDGLTKLEVTVTMNAPDKLGGMWVCDFLIRTS